VSHKGLGEREVRGMLGKYNLLTRLGNRVIVRSRERRQQAELYRVQREEEKKRKTETEKRKSRVRGEKK
jgi:hypothetical protein